MHLKVVFGVSLFRALGLQAHGMGSADTEGKMVLESGASLNAYSAHCLISIPTLSSLNPKP